MLSSDRWLTVKPGLPCVSCKVHMCLAASWGLWRQKPGGSEYSHALVPFPCMHEPAPLQANLVEAGSVLAHESRRRLFQVLPFTGAQTRRARRACWQAPCSTPGNARHTDTCDSTPRASGVAAERGRAAAVAGARAPSPAASARPPCRRASPSPAAPHSSSGFQANQAHTQPSRQPPGAARGRAACAWAPARGRAVPLTCTAQLSASWRGARPRGLRVGAGQGARCHADLHNATISLPARRTAARPARGRRPGGAPSR